MFLVIEKLFSSQRQNTFNYLDDLKGDIKIAFAHVWGESITVGMVNIVVFTMYNVLEIISVIKMNSQTDLF